MRVEGAGGILPRVKLWAGGLPEPAAAAIEAHLIGYFRPLAATDRIGAGPIFPLATEGLSNNFFGTNAGANNSAIDNSFFGGEAGRDNTTGGGNAFFGRDAGANNTTGSFNSFFGDFAGLSNTVESNPELRWRTLALLCCKSTRPKRAARLRQLRCRDQREPWGSLSFRGLGVSRSRGSDVSFSAPGAAIEAPAVGATEPASGAVDLRDRRDGYAPVLPCHEWAFLLENPATCL